MYKTLKQGRKLKSSEQDLLGVEKLLILLGIGRKYWVWEIGSKMLVQGFDFTMNRSLVIRCLVPLHPVTFTPRTADS